MDGVAVVSRGTPIAFIVPDILANGKTELMTAERHRVILLRGFKITVFVKDIICGQERLSARGLDSSLMQKSSGIGGGAARVVFIGAYMADNETSFAH